MFEQLVRPFAARPVTTTRRIVPVVSDAVPETAVITWGKAGTVPTGTQQPDATNLENIESVGFRLHNCYENWNQKNVTTEEATVPIMSSAGTQIGQTTVNRIREIEFSRRETQEQPFSYAAVGVASVVAGLRSSIPGSNSCDAKYKFNYD